MKFFKNKLNKNGIAVILSAIFLLLLGSTQFANADNLFGIPNASDFISILASSITYFIAFIFGVLIAIESWFIGIVLNINANILQTPLVQTGFSISLSIANLAFVLGIIVIALATILRNQTYGIKQLLWKLVVMAILVNFGLVIMSPIFAIGNSFTQYFLNCINPGAGSCTQTSGTSFQNFGTTFASAFNPANPWVAPATASPTSISQATTLVGAFSPNGVNGTNIGQAAVPLFGIVFTAIDLALIVIVLGGFIAMLTIRYLYIAILAILLPFAWAAWVFPSFNSHWKKWWEEFIRWTFFAPIVLFFVYLAFLTMRGVGATGVFNVASYTNSTWTSISDFLSGAFAPIISSFVQEILLAGLIVGGMIAANSMGIKMAGTVVEGAKKAGNAAKGYAQKQTKKGGSWAYQKTDKGVKKVTGTGLTERLQTGNIPFQSIPGVRRGASLLARGIQGSPIASNSKMVEDAQKKAPKNWETAKKNLEGSMNTEDQFAHIAVGIKEGKIKPEDLVNGKPVSRFLDDQDLIARYGQQKLVSDFDKATGTDANARRARLAMEDGKTDVKVVKDIKDKNGNVIPAFTAGTMANAQALKAAADEEFTRNNSKSDWGKAAEQFTVAAKSKGEKDQSQHGGNAAFNEYDNKLKNIIAYNLEAMPDIMKALKKSFDAKNFHDDMNARLDKIIEPLKSQRESIKKQLDSMEDSRIKELENVGDKLTDRQRKELSDLKADLTAKQAPLKTQMDSIDSQLKRPENAKKNLHRSYATRFESAADNHESHGDHDDEHKEEGGSHGKDSGGNHAAPPKPSKPSVPKPPSGGGDSHGGGGHH